MTPTPYELVRVFHEKFGIPVKDVPEQPSLDRLKLRVALHIEEFCELLAELIPTEKGRRWVDGMKMELMEDALMYLEDTEEVQLNLAAVAKELADLDMVGTGTAAELGIPHDSVVAAVHLSNMRKVPGGPIGEGAGTAVKPEDWEPPNIAAILDLAHHVFGDPVGE